MSTSSGVTPPDKVAISVKEMAQMCGLSRQRFGQLVKAGGFPAPLRDEVSGRPYYPPELQQVCLDVRRRNCGINGKVVMFYSARTPAAPKPTHPRPAAKPKVPVPDRHADLLDGLHGLGLTAATGGQVGEALAHLYPGGVDGVDPGQVLRGVFLYLRGKNPAEKLGGKE